MIHGDVTVKPQPRGGPHVFKVRCVACSDVIVCRPWEPGTCPCCRIVVFLDNAPTDDAVLVEG